MALIGNSWDDALGSHFATDAWSELQAAVASEREKHQVFPPADDTFRAFELTPYDDVRVVVLGQDPYHGAGQAHGLAFSVLPGIKLPPSLRNIFKELESDLGIPYSKDEPNGCLDQWAGQGVFLLNTVLTVRSGEANSHRKLGWLEFTDHVIGKLNEHSRDLIFVLWGKPAEKKRLLIDDRHHVLVSPHPSPLSASRGFFGSKPFSATNVILKSSGCVPVDWSLQARAKIQPQLFD